MLDKLCAVAVLLFIITAFVMLLPRPASAGYLRFMDYRDGALHPAPLLGGFLAPDSITTESEGGGMLPIITHSSRVDASGHHVDGCLLPSIACEDWSPFAVGGSFRNGRGRVDIGPIINIFPVFQNAALALLGLIGSEKMPGLRSALNPTPTGGSSVDVRFTFAPVWEFDPFYQAGSGHTNGHGYFRIFTGPQLLF